MKITERIRQCKKCNIKNYRPLVFGDPVKAKIVFVSEEPTSKASNSDFFEYYLGSPDKRFHFDWMLKMGITLNWLKEKPYITHVYKCCSAKRNKYEKCKDYWLSREKKLFNNKTIVTFGEAALLGIIERPYKRNKFREYIRTYNEFPTLVRQKSIIIPIIHPSWRNDKFIDENQNRIDWILAQIKKEIKKPNRGMAN
ncbi:MAG: hypothetical protein J7M11_00555 [Elusimicrobia bacterium]|nr:hypothetical protein [Elusimicrobiota bacterium]